MYCVYKNTAVDVALPRDNQPPGIRIAGRARRVARAARGRARLASIATRSDAPGAAHTWAVRRRPPPHVAGRLSRRASCTGTCSARCDREAPGAAHTWAARRKPPPPKAGGACRIRRTARGRARLAVIATRTRQVRHAHGPPGADPRRTWRGACRVARAARRRARLTVIRIATPRMRLGADPRRPWQGGMSRRASGTGTCSARCDHDAVDAAHTWAARRRPPPHVAGGMSRRASGTGTCSARCDRDAPGAAHTWAAKHRPPPHVAGWHVASRERHGDVLGSL